MVDLNKIIILITIILSVQFKVKVNAQNYCDTLKIKKSETYGFDPNNLSDSQRRLKITALNDFWDYAEIHKESILSCLSSSIQEELRDTYYSFDASSLLFRIDSHKEYRQSVINGLMKTNLNEIDPGMYLALAFMLSKENLDVSELALKFLRESENNLSLVQHNLMLTKALSGIFMYGLMDDSTSSTYLANNIISKVSDEVKHASTILLYFTNTDFGNKVLDSLKRENAISDSILSELDEYSDFLLKIPIKVEKVYNRNEVIEKLSWVPFNAENNWFGASSDTSLSYSAYKKLSVKDIDLVREARKRAIYDLSDEALHEYFALTKILFVLRNKQ